MGAETTKHKLQLFYKTQPSCYLVFQLGFYNNIQCRCGTVLEVELSERVVDVKTISERIIIVSGMQLSILFSICCSICCVYALPSTSQQCSLTIETSVANERSANFLISVVKLELKQLATSFSHAKL